MSSGNQSQPISTPSRISHHWWYNPKETGVFTSSPPHSPVYANSPADRSWGSGSMSSSPTSPSAFSTTAKDPKVAIPLPAPGDWNKWRRDSLKNFYHLDDFATPE